MNFNFLCSCEVRSTWFWCITKYAEPRISVGLCCHCSVCLLRHELYVGMNGKHLGRTLMLKQFRLDLWLFNSKFCFSLIVDGHRNQYRMALFMKKSYNWTNKKDDKLLDVLIAQKTQGATQFEWFVVKRY